MVPQVWDPSAVICPGAFRVGCTLKAARLDDGLIEPTQPGAASARTRSWLADCHYSFDVCPCLKCCLNSEGFV
ncbi:hypothetical protein J1614_009348 [Plenodomus biglobosus]|nr:hypothetical protein J1614_009348 [Plenodomus biglobosus]